MLYHNISPFCEPLSFVQFQYHNKMFAFVLMNFTLHFRTNFYCIFVRIFSSILLRFRPYLFCFLYKFYTAFWTLFQYEFSAVFWTLFQYEFSAVFSPLFFAQIDYHTVYIDLCLYHIFTQIFMNLNAVPFKTMNLIVIFEFFDAKPILQCL